MRCRKIVLAPCVRMGRGRGRRGRRHDEEAWDLSAIFRSVRRFRLPRSTWNVTPKVSSSLPRNLTTIPRRTLRGSAFQRLQWSGRGRSCASSSRSQPTQVFFLYHCHNLEYEDQGMMCNLFIKP
ncbi:MAG: multicopper oxidase domain-containing protein [Desulfovibrionales bacterium]